jgi:hypothetical protein
MVISCDSVFIAFIAAHKFVTLKNFCKTIYQLGSFEKLSKNMNKEMIFNVMPEKSFRKQKTKYIIAVEKVR